MNIPNKKLLNLFAIIGLVVICLISFHQLLFSGEIINATDILTSAVFLDTSLSAKIYTLIPVFRPGCPILTPALRSAAD